MDAPELQVLEAQREAEHHHELSLRMLQDVIRLMGISDMGKRQRLAERLLEFREWEHADVLAVRVAVCPERGDLPLTVVDGDDDREGRRDVRALERASGQAAQQPEADGIARVGEDDPGRAEHDDEPGPAHDDASSRASSPRVAPSMRWKTASNSASGPPQGSRMAWGDSARKSPSRRVWARAAGKRRAMRTA